mgnify:CR=1 FL=1
MIHNNNCTMKKAKNLFRKILRLIRVFMMIECPKCGGKMDYTCDFTGHIQGYGMWYCRKCDGDIGEMIYRQ